MTRFYINVETGSDAAAGTSWATARKTTLNLTGVVAGDEISFAKTTGSDEVTVAGTWSGTNNTANLTGNATVDCKQIVRAVSSYTAYNSAVTGLSTGRGTYTPIAGDAYTAFNGGALTYPASPTANTKYAVMDLGSTIDLSPYTDLSIWMAIGSLAFTDAMIVVKLCSDASGDVPVETFPITLTQYVGASGTNIQLLKGSALSSTVRSVAIYSGSSAPPGSANLFWSCLTAYKSTATVRCNDWVYKSDWSVMGQVVMIDSGETSAPVIWFAYAAHKNLHDWSAITLKRRRPFAVHRADKSSTTTTQPYPLRFGGSNNTTRVLYKGGYNTGTDLVDGITFLDDSTAPTSANCQNYFSFSTTYATTNFVTMENLWVGGHYGMFSLNSSSDTSTFNFEMTNCALLGCNNAANQIGMDTVNRRPVVKWTATNCIFGPGSYYVGNSNTDANTSIAWTCTGCYAFNALIGNTFYGVYGTVTLTNTTFYFTSVTLKYNSLFGVSAARDVGLAVAFSNFAMKGGGGTWLMTNRLITANGRWGVTGTCTFDTATASLNGRGVWSATTTTLKSWTYVPAQYYLFRINGTQNVPFERYPIEVSNVTWADYVPGSEQNWSNAHITDCSLTAAVGAGSFTVQMDNCLVEDCTFVAASRSSATPYNGHISINGGTTDAVILKTCAFTSVLLYGAAGGGLGGVEAYDCTWTKATPFGLGFCGTWGYGLKVINAITVGGGNDVYIDTSDTPWIGPYPLARKGLCVQENYQSGFGLWSVVNAPVGQIVQYAVDSTNTYYYPTLGSVVMRLAGIAYEDQYEIVVANVAVVAGHEMTASIWHNGNGGIVGYLKAKSCQLTGQPELRTFSTLSSNTWEKISVIYTPTVSGIIEFYITGNGFFAEFTCVQT